jgi:salicylate hydroxylase
MISVPDASTHFTLGLIPMKEACAAIGDEHAQNSYVWVGKGACIMTYPVDHGDTFNIVAINSSYNTWGGAWVQTADYHRIKEEFSGWGEHVQKIIDLLDRPGTQAWSMWDDPLTPTYFKGLSVMLGDGAHATTPFQGQY